MKRLYILCEGQTEEEFVNAILNPYLQLEEATDGLLITRKEDMPCLTVNTTITKWFLDGMH